MSKVKILWVDDEIDLLKPHIMFLQEKGYDVVTSNNGDEGLDLVNENIFDIIFLDENMPGISGLETLTRIRNKYPDLPVVMITKNDQEHTMEGAIGSKISDYLIKPVNPHQILLCLKKNLENKRLVSEKTTQAYQQQFRTIGLEFSNRLNFEEWKDIYRKMVFWELELEKSTDDSMNDVLLKQKFEANAFFTKYYENNYMKWLNGVSDETPVLSHTLIREKLFPELYNQNPIFLIVIDNFRYDQWKTLQPTIEQYYRVVQDDMFYSIIPSATQYSRNSIFSGLLPSEIEKKYPDYWVQEDEEGTKNQFESKLFAEQLLRNKKNIKYSYTKITNHMAGKKYVENLPNLMGNKLNILVYNFVDMLSHAYTEMEIIRELADDESAYRSLTLSWFKHSPLMEVIKFVAGHKFDLMITTDHGSVKVTNPMKILGDKDTNTNLRYKVGKAMTYDKKQVFEIKHPQDVFLPRLNVSSIYTFCRSYDFFAYPNNYNYHVNYYKNTFQHGGISMEEILIPIIFLSPK